MRAICGECGLQTEVTPTGRSAYEIIVPKAMPRVCPVVAAKLAAKGALDGDDMQCDHLDAAADKIVRDRLSGL